MAGSADRTVTLVDDGIIVPHGENDSGGSGRVTRRRCVFMLKALLLLPLLGAGLLLLLPSRKVDLLRHVASIVAAATMLATWRSRSTLRLGSSSSRPAPRSGSSNSAFSMNTQRRRVTRPLPPESFSPWGTIMPSSTRVTVRSALPATP